MPAVPDTTVKYYNSGWADAPTVTNTWGNLTAFLDAVLVTGFGLKVVNSITFDPATGLAKAIISSGHDFQKFQVVKVEGSFQPEYNGEWRVDSVTTNDVYFKLAETPSSNVATPSPALSMKSAPLGFEIAFTRDYKRCYRSLNPNSPGNMLVVYDGPKDTGYDNGWAKWANVGISESMVDVDTHTGAQAPYDPNNPRQNWKSVQANQFGWHKWYFGLTSGYDYSGDSGGGNRNWVIIGDSQMF